MSTFKKFFHHRSKDQQAVTTTSATSSSMGAPTGSNISAPMSGSGIPPAGTSSSLGATTYSPVFTNTQTSGLNNPSGLQEGRRHVQTGGQGMGAVQSETQPTVTTVEKQPVIQEQIQEVERDVIQPVVHREREQTEIHQITQPLTQVEVRPTFVEDRVLPTETRPVIREQPRSMPPPIQLKSSTITAPRSVSVVEENPVVEEVIHKVVREEIQPVVYKQTIVPSVVQQQKPIYERIIEAPIIIREERAPIILREGEAFTNMLGQQPKMMGGQGETIISQPPVSTLPAKMQTLNLNKDVIPPPTESVTTTTTTVITEGSGVGKGSTTTIQPRSSTTATSARKS